MVKIRLMRMGAKKRPFYRVVVADSRSPRDGRFIENIGKYHPLQHPSLIEIDADRALHWLRNGAQPSEPVRNLFVKAGVWEQFTGEAPPPSEEDGTQPEPAPQTEPEPAPPEEPEPASPPDEGEGETAAAETESPDQPEGERTEGP